MVLHSFEYTLIFENYSFSLFVMGCSLDHLSLVVHWVISELVYFLRAFHSLDHLCYKFRVTRFGECSMRSFASWIKVDIHWVWGSINLSLRSSNHCRHYHSIIGDMTFLSCTDMRWSSFFVSSH